MLYYDRRARFLHLKGSRRSELNRLRIVNILSDCEKCFCVILQAFDITQPTLSHHMKILYDCGLVNVRKEGKWSYYFLNFETLRDFQGFIGILNCESIAHIFRMYIK